MDDASLRALAVSRAFVDEFQKAWLLSA
jgi:hypothetical protein